MDEQIAAFHQVCGDEVVFGRLLATGAICVESAYSNRTGEWHDFVEERWAIPAKDVVRFLSAKSASTIREYEKHPSFPKPIRPGGVRLWYVDELKDWLKNQAPRVGARGTWTTNRRAAEAKRRQKATAAEVIQ